jgi:integrase
MGRNATRGLINRKGIWHIDKVVRGRRVCESTGESDLGKAEEFLARKIEQIRQAGIYGVRPKRTFRQAAIKYLNETTKRSLKRDAIELKKLDPYIGSLPVESIHMGTLEPYIQAQKKACKKKRTINYALQVTRRILCLAADEWMDEFGLTWLARAPKIRLLKEDDKRAPFPLSWEQQDQLFGELPRHLKRMALFAVNTGCRDREICNLRWDWEVEVPALATTIFVIPKEYVKNQQDRIVVLNSVARATIEEVRGQDPDYVFTYRGGPIKAMCRNGWRDARERAGLPSIRVHDLKHTYGHRLRTAGVSFEDTQDLLGHKSNRITDHYSSPGICRLIDSAEKVTRRDSRKSPALVILRKQFRKVKTA